MRCMKYFIRKLEEPNQAPLYVAACICNEKFRFHPKSEIKNYLQNCKGFVLDADDKYSVNYILLVLLSHWKAKGLSLSSPTCSSEIKTLFEWRGDTMPLSLIRSMLLFDLVVEPQFRDTYREYCSDYVSSPFWKEDEETELLIYSYVSCKECTESGNFINQQLQDALMVPSHELPHQRAGRIHSFP